jgi:RHS repeat-associated protein
MFGNLVQADVDCCQSKKWNFSATTQYAYPDSETCGASGGPQLTTSFTYNAYTGQTASTTDPNNQTTSYTYDSMRRRLTVTHPDQSQTKYAYNDSTHTLTTTDPIDSSHAQNTTEYQDGLARPVKGTLTDASQNLYSTVQRQYDPLGRDYNHSNPYTTSAQYWTSTQFDALGRVTKKILQDNSQISLAYSGAAITLTDAVGRQRKSQLDGLHRIVNFYEPDPANNNSLTLQTTYAYTILDWAATITQGSQTRTFNYDGMGRVTSETHPESGATSYQYNIFDKVTQRTDARGVITTYTYDTLNRLTGISYNVGSTGVSATPSVSYSYGTNAAQYNNGRLITMTDGRGSTSYSYNLMGRKSQETQTIGGTPYTVSYQYNQNGDLTSLTYPSGRVVQQTYDAIGRPASVASGTTTYLSAITYNADSSASGLTLGNGVTTTLGYAPDRRELQSLTYSHLGTTLFGQTYTYGQTGSNGGQITQLTDAVDSGRNMTYTYDALNRLSTAASQGSTNYPQWGLSWAYDRYGNRLSQTVTAGSGPSNSVVVSTTTNHITTSGYTYDTNGNMTGDGVNTLVYDADNRAISAADGSGTASYSYNGSGFRVQKSFGGTTTVYIFSETSAIAEYANGTLSEEYVYVGDSLLADYSGGTLTYHGRDFLSARLKMDTSGNKVGEQGHYPFGEDWYMTNNTTKWHFTNYERDSESSNDYAKFRYHVNRLARFLTVDPLPPPRRDPQLLNRYSYVASDPINRADPDGRYACVSPPGPFKIHCICCNFFSGCSGCEPPCPAEGGNCEDLPIPPILPPLPPLPSCDFILSPEAEITARRCDGNTSNLQKFSAIIPSGCTVVPSGSSCKGFKSGGSVSVTGTTPNFDPLSPSCVVNYTASGASGQITGTLGFTMILEFYPSSQIVNHTVRPKVLCR